MNYDGQPEQTRLSEGIALEMPRAMILPRFSVLCVVFSALIFAASPGRADFPKLFNTQEESERLLKPEEALARITVPDGFEVTLFAAEPAVQQPIDMAFDERGRLWVAENYTYAERETNFETRLSDRIIIL